MVKNSGVSSPPAAYAVHSARAATRGPFRDAQHQDLSYVSSGTVGVMFGRIFSIAGAFGAPRAGIAYPLTGCDRLTHNV